jgi:hypothetical protein
MSQEILTNIARSAYESDDVALSRFLLNLARKCCLEMKDSGLGPIFFYSGQVTWESYLLHGVIPEMSRRLMEPAGLTVLFLPEERIFNDIPLMSDRHLRLAAGHSMRKSNMMEISLALEEISKSASDQVSAAAAISAPIGQGNVVEIVVSRLAEPVLSEGDYFATTLHADRCGDKISWSPHDHLQEVVAENEISFT